MCTSLLLEDLVKKKKEISIPRIPASIQHLGTMPLYRAVAWWGLFLGREFDRDDICRAFNIPPSNDSNVINYLCNKHDGDDIIYESRKEQVRGVHTRRVLHILGIDPYKEHRPQKIMCKSQGAAWDRLVARWMLSRPVINEASEIEVWKAAFPVKE